MNVLIVFNHPYKGSYCSAILNSVQEGLNRANHNVDLIHLDEDGFNPVMKQEDLLAFRNRKVTDPQSIAYINRLEKADCVVFIFPIWWELMPALMKGFIDKVIFPGSFYNYTDSGNFMSPLMKNIKHITVITTMNTPRPLYKLIYGNAIKKAFIRGTLRKTGYKNISWINLSMVKSVSRERRGKWLANIENRFAKLR